MSTLHNSKKQKQPSANAYCDVVWKLQELTPEAPKKDGRAEAYLREIGISFEAYMCNTLVVVKADLHKPCSVCKQKQKTTKFCRLIQNSVVNDISICTDCINVFVEYNPNSVFDFETKENQ